jgi:hypothetical protein
MREKQKWEWCERYRLQGKVRLLRHLLEHRFGTLPPWVDQRLATAGEEELIGWGRSMLSIELSLEQLLRT